MLRSVKARFVPTNIGIDDQHRAIQKLPREDIARKSGTTNRLQISRDDAEDLNP